MNARTATITLILYGIIAGNYSLSGIMAGYTTVVNILFLFLGVGIVATKLGQRRALMFGSLGAVFGNGLMALLWWFDDERIRTGNGSCLCSSKRRSEDADQEHCQ